jgi:hypothetical protein
MPALANEAVAKMYTKALTSDSEYASGACSNFVTIWKLARAVDETANTA